MELNQISNVDYGYLNSLNSSNNVSEKANITKNDKVQNDVVSLEQNWQSSSNMSMQLSQSIQKVSNIQIAQQNVVSANETITKLEFVVSNTPQIDDAYNSVNQLIDEYNNIGSNLSSQLSKTTVGDTSRESRVYFDGIVGARPLSVDEINQAVEKQKENLKVVDKQLNNEMQIVSKKADNIILEAKEVQKEKSPFKQIDFGKESSNFTSNNFSAVSGAIATAQPNPFQSHSVRLLA